MAEHTNFGRFAKAALERNYKLKRNDIESDARLTKWGMTFTTKSFEIGEIGHFCIMRLKAFGGIMKMETVVFSPTGVDAPLMNLDWVRVLQPDGTGVHRHLLRAAFRGARLRQ